MVSEAASDVMDLQEAPVKPPVQGRPGHWWRLRVSQPPSGPTMARDVRLPGVAEKNLVSRISSDGAHILRRVF
jgi:hypothetical protein